MDSKQTFFSKSPLILIGIGIVLLVGLFVWSSWKPESSKTGKVLANTLGDTWSLSRLVELYGDAWTRLQKKVIELRHAQEENQKLRLENVHLKLSIEELQFGCNTQTGANFTDKVGIKLSKETGDRAGRVLASIQYKLPTRILPSQLYTLGVSYLKAREDEKAAVIFTSLTGMEYSNAYKTAKDYLITAVAWYRLENYSLANSYLDQALKVPEKEDSIRFQAQARLWKALVAKKLRKEIQAQYWLRELVDHHPYSIESSWINGDSRLNQEVENANGQKD